MFVNNALSVSIGPQDVICIFRPRNGLYYAAVLTRRPLEDDMVLAAQKFGKPVVWLMTALHTEGDRSLGKARKKAQKMRRRFGIPSTNSFTDRAFDVETPVSGAFIADWLLNADTSLADELRKAFVEGTPRIVHQIVPHH